MPELQAAGLVPLLMGTGGDDGVAPTLCTRLVRTRAEQQRVAQLPWDPLKELTQGLWYAHTHSDGRRVNLILYKRED